MFPLKKGCVMRKLMAVMFLFLSFVLVNVNISRAQEDDNDKFSFGTVVAIAEGQVTIKEYDFANDADVNVVYAVTAETEFGNINALTDLAVNDDIVIDYVEKDGKRSISTLVKEEKGTEVPVAAEAAE